MYIVIELQKSDTQTLSSLTWSYADEQQAWSKYYIKFEFYTHEMEE